MRGPVAGAGMVRWRLATVPTMRAAPVNPFLAASGNAMAHGRSDQQDNVPWRGPEGPTEELGDADLQYTWLGPCHFGGNVSGPYPDGRRVIWSNGRETIVKLDYDSLELLAEHEIDGAGGPTPQAQLEANLAGLDEKEGWEAIEHGIELSLRYMTGLDGVYSLLDRDHTFFLGRKDHAVAYVDTDPTDPASPIVERDRWDKPADIEGFFVGINLTFDGWLVMTTDHRWVVLEPSPWVIVAVTTPSISASWRSDTTCTSAQIRSPVCIDHGRGSAATITGRQASTSTGHEAFARRSRSNTPNPPARLGSAR